MDEIKHFLQSGRNTRVIFGYRWLLWDNAEWWVIGQGPYQSQSRTFYSGDDLARALEVLANSG